MERLLVLIVTLATVTHAGPFSGRIVGGHDAEDGQFPYQVSLQVDGDHVCGGSIINERWILTAGHCLHDPGTYTVLTGTNKLSKGGIRYDVEKQIEHASSKRLIDIGLVKVIKPIAMSDKVKTIEIHTGPVLPASILTFSGWGWRSWPEGAVSDDLQTIEFISITNNQCNRLGMPVEDYEMCTFNDDGEGVCRGDSGGALVYYGRLAGILARGIPCAKGYPDVYSRVSSYIDWINDTINNN